MEEKEERSSFDHLPDKVIQATAGNSFINCTEVHLRWLIRRDLPEVMEIENQCFQFPWPEDELIRCLRQRNTIGQVAEHSDRVVGFMIYELLKNGIRIFNLAVDAGFRRRQIGSKMVNKLIGKLSPQRRNRITLEVSETNLPAQVFFQRHGFRAISVLRDYYDDTDQDAYRMRYDLERSPSSDEP